jgi:hypothetical protein
MKDGPPSFFFLKSKELNFIFLSKPGVDFLEKSNIPDYMILIICLL